MVALLPRRGHGEEAWRGAAGAAAERGSVTRSTFACKLGPGRPGTCFAWRAAAAHRAALRKFCAHGEHFHR